MEIRDAKTADFDAVIGLLHQLWPRKRLHRKTLRRIFDRALRSSSTQYLCATEHGEVVGFCSLSTAESLWVEGELLHLDELVVDSKHRGRGIGRELLRSVLTIARRRGAKRVELDSATHRKGAHRFYEQGGFENRGYVFSKPID